MSVEATQQVFSPSKLRERRKAAGLRREALAWGVGVSYETIGNYERGATQPSAKVVTRLAQLLGCDVADLFEVVDA
jgi:DNA-binding XRE family transcriptional regulator